jgi:hypothetical protein
VIRNWSPGQTARKKPARLDPIAGAMREVKDLDMRGFRRRNGFASFVRRLSRSRVKKRRRSLWESRMRESEHVRRTFGDFQPAVRGWDLRIRKYQNAGSNHLRRECTFWELLAQEAVW